jgi:hypothetical protein
MTGDGIPLAGRLPPGLDTTLGLAPPGPGSITSVAIDRPAWKSAMRAV